MSLVRIKIFAFGLILSWAKSQTVEDIRHQARAYELENCKLDLIFCEDDWRVAALQSKNCNKYRISSYSIRL